MNGKNYTLLAILIILLFTTGQAQLKAGCKLSVGHSLTGSNNLYHSKKLAGLTLGLNWHPKSLPSRFRILLDMGITFQEANNPNIDQMRFRQTFVGFGYVVGNMEKENMLVLGPLQSTMVLKDNYNPVPINRRSTWTQLGYEICATRRIRNWCSVHLTYQKLVARSYDANNFQSLLSCGVILNTTWGAKSDDIRR